MILRDIHNVDFLASYECISCTIPSIRTCISSYIPLHKSRIQQFRPAPPVIHISQCGIHNVPIIYLCIYVQWTTSEPKLDRKRIILANFYKKGLASKIRPRLGTLLQVLPQRPISTSRHVYAMPYLRSLLRTPTACIWYKAQYSTSESLSPVVVPNKTPEPRAKADWRVVTVNLVWTSRADDVWSWVYAVQNPHLPA